jgi:hypothetical protein
MVTLMNDVTAFIMRKSEKNPPLEIAGALMATARNIYIQELGHDDAKRILRSFTALNDNDINITIH